jgi:murein DD-endopeptidase MepM/ murein hydrolase activator NlpD
VSYGTRHKKANRPVERFLTTAIFVVVMTGFLLLIFSPKPQPREALSPIIYIPDVKIPEKVKVDSTKPADPIIEPLTPAVPANGANTQPLISPDPRGGSSVLSNLIIPVAGVKPESLRDTYADARSDGRVHNAIDIMAPHGSPVLAANDGTIQRLFYSERGGNTLYQLSADGKWVFYYAHLDSYAPSASAGKSVKKGEVIAYVGDTGNAGSGNYHLHFSIWAITNPKRIWEGENIDPYPLLRK